VELHLVPGHNGVPGNMRAHDAAYAAAKGVAAAAGIRSTEQGFALHEALCAATAPSSAQASPVQAGKSKKSRKRSLPLSQPLLWKKHRAKTPPTLVSSLDPTDEDSEELVNTKGNISMSIPGPHSVRPDRTPEPAPLPGSSFTPINSGSLSSTGFTPVNASSNLSTGSPAKVLSSRVKRAALNSQYWFMPVDARQMLWGASPSQSLSASIQKPALDKKQEADTVTAKSAESYEAQFFGPGPLVSGLRNEPVSIDNAACFLGSGQLLFPPVNNVPAAVLDSSAVSKSCSAPPNPEKTPGSMPSSPLHRFLLQDSRKAVFGETLSSCIPQGNQPAAKTSALAAVSS
jgi:hypothetical protein